MKKNETFGLFNDVKFRIEEEKIIVKKGIWNVITIEIEKTLFPILNNWIEMKKIWKKFITTHQITTNNSAILKILNDCCHYFILYKKNKILKIDMIISDFEKDNFKIFNCDVFKFDTGLEIIKNNNNIKRIMVVHNKYNEDNFLLLNKLLFLKKIKCFYSLIDGNYIHLLNIDNFNLGCFGCVVKRFLSRHEEWDNNKIQYDKTINVIDDCTNFLLYMNKLILNTSQLYEKIILNNKIFSIFLPTFEIHIDRILKVPFCDVCGYITKNQSEELNINLKTAIKEIINND